MTSAMTVLCPGQGAQTPGMGREWSERSTEARAVFERADATLAGDGAAKTLGGPLSTVCFEGPEATLNRTDVSQPAIYTVGVACWHGLCAEMGYAPGEAPLGCAAGLSLGEYTALCVAGALGFEDGLKLVALRGRAMQEAAEARPSGMVALIGAEEQQAQDLCAAVLEELGEGEVLVPANFNAPGQVVVSGTVAACDRAESLAADRGLKASRLSVAGAFHSPIMARAAERLRAALSVVEIRRPRCPVLSNVTGEPHKDDPDSIRERLVEQLTKPVRWADNGAWMVRHAQPLDVHELAPGRTLAGLMRRIDRGTKVMSHDQPS